MSPMTMTTSSDSRSVSSGWLSGFGCVTELWKVRLQPPAATSPPRTTPTRPEDRTIQAWNFGAQVVNSELRSDPNWHRQPDTSRSRSGRVSVGDEPARVLGGGERAGLGFERDQIGMRLAAIASDQVDGA